MKEQLCHDVILLEQDQNTADLLTFSLLLKKIPLIYCIPSKNNPEMLGSKLMLIYSLSRCTLNHTIKGTSWECHCSFLPFLKTGLSSFFSSRLEAGPYPSQIAIKFREISYVGTSGHFFSFQQVKIFFHWLLDWNSLIRKAQTESKSVHN